MCYVCYVCNCGTQCIVYLDEGSLSLWSVSLLINIQWACLLNQYVGMCTTIDFLVSLCFDDRRRMQRCTNVTLLWFICCLYTPILPLFMNLGNTFNTQRYSMYVIKITGVLSQPWTTQKSMRAFISSRSVVSHPLVIKPVSRWSVVAHQWHISLKNTYYCW